MDPEEGQEVEAAETPVEGGEQTEQTPEGGINPAWAPIQEKLGPIAFKSIENDLRGFDTSVQKRFDKFNQDFGWARELQKQGFSPEQISGSVQLAQQLDQDPVAFYQRLEQFLQENGRMPQSQEELVEETDDPNEEPQDPRIAQMQAQLDQMTAQQNQQVEFFRQQEQMRVDREADDANMRDIQALREAHPELSKNDVKDVLDRAVAMMATTGQFVSVNDAYEAEVAYRNRLLSQPRPGDSAPRLVPSSGGNAAVAQTRSLGEIPRDDIQNLIATHLQQNR